VGGIGAADGRRQQYRGNSKFETRNSAVSEQAKTLAQQQRDFQTAVARIKKLTANLKEQSALL
jgi:hypothetical protein